MKLKSRVIFLSAIILVIVSIFSCSFVFAESTDVWTAKAALSSIRGQHQVVVVNGKFYVIGGVKPSGITNNVEEYDPGTNTWTAKTSMANARNLHQVAVVNGKIYAIGGGESSAAQKSVEEYDPITNTWVAKSSMTYSRREFQVAVVSGKIYAIGGVNENGFSIDKVEEYTVDTNTWTVKTAMPYSKNYHQVAVVSGKIYVTGGLGGTKTVEEYNPTTSTWTAKAPMNIGRINHQVAVVDGKIYAIGGSTSINSQQVTTNTIEEYNPETNTWTMKASMNESRDIFNTLVINGKIYVFGGRTVEANVVTKYLNSFEEYDPTTNMWTTKASMINQRIYLGVAYSNNEIYAIGGYNGTSYLSSVEEYALPVKVISSPTNLKATPDDNKVYLSWDAVGGATSYNLKRATTAGGSYETIPSNPSNITGTTYTDTAVINGTTYYYVVSAVVNGTESPNSNEASATPTTPVVTGNSGILELTMTNGVIKEYDLTATELQSFLAWYDGRSNGADKAYYMFTKKSNIKPFLSREEYISFDKISSFEVNEYAE